MEFTYLRILTKRSDIIKIKIIMTKKYFLFCNVFNTNLNKYFSQLYIIDVFFILQQGVRILNRARLEPYRTEPNRTEPNRTEPYPTVLNRNATSRTIANPTVPLHFSCTVLITFVSRFSFFFIKSFTISDSKSDRFSL